LDIGPQIDGSAVDNYRTIKLVLVRMTELCVRDTGTGRKARKHEQRLLRNMGVHLAVLDLLRIPYDKVVTCQNNIQHDKLVCISGKHTSHIISIVFKIIFC